MSDDTPEAEPAPPLLDSEPATPRFPWPPAEDTPVTEAYVDTWRNAVFHPAEFFRAMPRTTPFGAALLYYLIIGITGAALQMFWAGVLPRPQSRIWDEVLGTAMGSSPLVDFLLSPLYLLLSLYAAAALTHLLILMLVPDHGRIGTTLRIFCFAYSPIIFGVIPVVGTIVAFLWMTVLSIVGIREAHHTTNGRALAAVLIPVLFALIFLALAALLMMFSTAL